MKKVILLVVILFVSKLCFCQSFYKKSVKSVYAMYAYHLTTKYHNASGSGNLVGRKFPFSLEAGLNLDYQLKDHLFIRTGIASHIHFLSEISYGIIGPYPPIFEQGYLDNNRYGKGGEYIELVSAGIPLKIGYDLPKRGRYILSVSAGPMINFYASTKNNNAGSQWQNLSRGFTRAYLTTRTFRNDKNGKSIGISYPQLEVDADITVKRKTKHFGLLGLGIKGHIGSTRLENTTFVIWPTEPGYTSAGYFRLNRSYFGLFASYTFGGGKEK